MTTMEEGKRIRRVCVTGGGGYIGSWLVKNLLQKGYTVNATLRDPEKVEKSGHLLSLEGAKERLNLFRAHLCEEGSFDAAVQGCQAVFHVATPMDFIKHPENPEENVIQPAVKGGLNVLKSCSRAKSVRRVVYTSSVTAASPLNDNGEYCHPSLDESCWTPVDLMRNKQPISWMYFVSKTVAEQAAIQYGRDNGMEVVSIVPGVVGGPCLTPALPVSTRAAVCLITGDEESYERMKSVELLLGCIPLVHVEDVCNAHVFLMEQPIVEGRYICCADAVTLVELAHFFSQRYPRYNLPFKLDDGHYIPCKIPISSKKLLDMGFSYKYGLEHILEESIEYAQKFCVLDYKESS